MNNLGYSSKKLKSIEIGDEILNITDMNKILDELNLRSSSVINDILKGLYGENKMSSIENMISCIDNYQIPKKILDRTPSDKLEMVMYRSKMGLCISDICKNVLKVNVTDFCTNNGFRRSFVSTLIAGNALVTVERLDVICKAFGIDKDTNSYKKMLSYVEKGYSAKYDLTMSKKAKENHCSKQSGYKVHSNFTIEEITGIFSTDIARAFVRERVFADYTNNAITYINKSNNKGMAKIKYSDDKMDNVSLYRFKNIVNYLTIQQICAMNNISLNNISRVFFNNTHIICKYAEGFIRFDEVTADKLCRVMCADDDVYRELLIQVLLPFMLFRDDTNTRRYVNRLMNQPTREMVIERYKDEFPILNSLDGDPDEEEIELVEEEEIEAGDGVEEVEVELNSTNTNTICAKNLGDYFRAHPPVNSAYIVTDEDEDIFKKEEESVYMSRYDLDRLRFKKSSVIPKDEKACEACKMLGMILSKHALVNNITISALADIAGLEVSSMKKICLGEEGISIYHMIRICDEIHITGDDRKELERLATESMEAQIPTYIKNYISNPIIAKTLARCAELKTDPEYFEELLKEVNSDYK
jgi:plasmid maintenance system antidote protein VapI